MLLISVNTWKTETKNGSNISMFWQNSTCFGVVAHDNLLLDIWVADFRATACQSLTTTVATECIPTESCSVTRNHWNSISFVLKSPLKLVIKPLFITSGQQPTLVWVILPLPNSKSKLECLWTTYLLDSILRLICPDVNLIELASARRLNKSIAVSLLVFFFFLIKT